MNLTQCKTDVSTRDWTGVICEYNPLHNGHAFHLREISRRHGGGIVCVMSGSFVQRGEPAVCDKWLRAEMALRAGADLVIELPALFAVRSARDFAHGGVSLLKMMGIKRISFGSEVADEALLRETASLLHREPAGISERTQANLRLGHSHPRALTQAIRESIVGEITAQNHVMDPDETARALSSPNAMLGIEYLRAGMVLDWPLEAFVVPREGQHHEQRMHAMASASAIRAAWRENGCESIVQAAPECTMALLRDTDPAWPDALSLLMLDALRERAEALIGLPGWEPGLERRLTEAAKKSASFEEALMAAKCKRYPHARLKRLAAQLLLGMTAEVVKDHPAPTYLRVLGFTQRARPLLRCLSDAQVPVVMKASQLREDGVFAIERRATDLQALCLPHRITGRDFTQNVVVMEG